MNPEGNEWISKKVTVKIYRFWVWICEPGRKRMDFKKVTVKIHRFWVWIDEPGKSRWISKKLL
jgi:hypothetical protein